LFKFIPTAAEITNPMFGSFPKSKVEYWLVVEPLAAKLLSPSQFAPPATFTYQLPARALGAAASVAAATATVASNVFLEIIRISSKTASSAAKCSSLTVDREVTARG
jgi:hypothetical protein